MKKGSQKMRQGVAALLAGFLLLQLVACAAPAPQENATASTSTAASESTAPAQSPAPAASEAPAESAPTTPEQADPNAPVGLADKIDSFENGAKYARGAIKVVDLHGTWREMGRQYGKLMQAELGDVYAFVELIAEASEANQKKAASTVANQTAQCPYTIREFFAGAAETSGMTEEQLQTVNAVERIAGLPKCSAAFAWGDYAKDDLVIGRNYDYSDNFSMLSDDIAVTVYHPADGALATATIGYVGEIYAVNALNEKGMFMELNNGTPSASMKPEHWRITGTTLLLDMMFEADSLAYTDLYFDTAACSSSFIINMADATGARSYEWCPIGTRHGETDLPEGLMVSTNHFVNPDWGFELPTDENSWESLTRRQNLIDLCTAQKGQLDAEAMKKIINTTLEEGGAENELTVYQLVVVPETLTLWLRIKDGAEWTAVDMPTFLLGQA